MFERQLRPAQDFIENPLPHPQRQSREAGSCSGRFGPAVAGVQPSSTDDLARRSVIRRPAGPLPATGIPFPDS